MSRVTDHFQRAKRSLAGGVSSSTRVNRAIGHPMYVARAEGCKVWDLDGREYYDLCCSHGATLLGHGDPRVTAAVQQAMASGAACSYENESLADLAELLCDTIPSFERVRFTGSGTEATMHTLRLARAFTGRSKILKIEGNFHGYHDQVMYSIGTPVGALGPESSPNAWPGSSGMTPGLAEQLVLVPYNRADLLAEAIRKHAHELAAVICEPVYYNAGCIVPTTEFMQVMRQETERHGILLAEAIRKHAHELAAVICEPVYYNAGCIVPTTEFMQVMRQETERHGILLIFDEVQSAFRMGPGGAQEYLGITPDLCTVGKAVGGGFPLSVFGGRADIMAKLMPQGDCQHSGTYNGHPVVVAAALAAVRAYREPGFYEHIFAIADQLYGGMNRLFEDQGVPGLALGVGARFGIYFGVEGTPSDFRQTLEHQRETMLKFIAAAIDNGVYLHDYGGGACHHGFCAAMTSSDVVATLERLETAFESLKVREPVSALTT